MKSFRPNHVAIDANIASFVNMYTNNSLEWYPLNEADVVHYSVKTVIK